MDTRALLAASPLFTGLPPEALDSLQKLAHPLGIRSGQTLFAEGEPSDHFFIVATGRFRVTAGGRLVGYAGRLEPLGEVGVIAGEQRSASAQAIRDSLLLRLERQPFLEFLITRPTALVAMVRVLIRRMRQNQRQVKLASARSPRAFAIVAATPRLEACGLAAELAKRLERWASTRLLREDDGRRALGGEAASGVFGESDEAMRLLAWLNELELRHRYLVYDAGAEPDTWSALCMRQADRVLVLGDSAEPPVLSPILEAVRKCGTLAPVELILLRRDGAPSPNTLAWREQCGARAHFFLRPDDSADLDRIARLISGRALGLTLGGGGARGFAHIGLVRALEELQLPVDLGGGSSMGAFLAALAATGMNSADMKRIAREMFVDHNYLNDYVLPRVSLIRGRKFLRRLGEIFGGQRIEDLRLPYFCVCTNLTRGDALVLDRGPLDVWIGASMAVPGIAPPIAWRGELLCDGAVINSLPTDIMQSLERGPIVASDVSTEGDIRAPGAGMETPDPSALIHWQGPGEPPGLRDILFRTATLTSESGVRRRAEHADAYVRMPVGGIGMFDWKRMDEIVQRGYEHALAQLGKVREALLR